MTVDFASQIAGSVKIRVQAKSGRIERVEVDATRPTQAAAILRGRTSAEAVRLIPLLFSLCANAQSVAAATACERALGLSTAPETAAQRRYLLNVERAKEHSLRFLTEWPHWLGLPREKALAARLLGLCNALGEPHASPKALIEFIRGRILGPSWQAGQELIQPAAQSRVEAVVGRLLQRLEELGWTALGGQERIKALEPLPPGAWWPWFDENGARFCARPEYQGQPRENTPLSRSRDAPAVKLATERWGTGLGTRLLALASELEGALIALDRANTGAGLPMTGDQGTDPDLWISSANCAQNAGIACVEAPRGRLIHQVTLVDGRIQNYRVCAPTEWNFHPRGTAVAALGSIPFVSIGDYRARAQALIGAIDPCVGYDLEVHAHA